MKVKMRNVELKQKVYPEEDSQHLQINHKQYERVIFVKIF